MTVTFYTTSSDYRKLDKALTQTGSYTGIAHKKKSDLKLDIKLPGDAYNIVSGSNYVYIDVFDKYYFKEEYSIENNTVSVTLKEDVRVNFKQQIRGLRCTVTRSEDPNAYNGYLQDEAYKAYGYRNIVVKQFPNSLDDMSIILITVG